MDSLCILGEAELQQGFNSANDTRMWSILKLRGMLEIQVILLKNLYKEL